MSISSDSKVTAKPKKDEVRVSKMQIVLFQKRAGSGQGMALLLGARTLVTCQMVL